MGGIGSRLKCNQKGVSSKIFYETCQGLVLKNIMDNINDVEQLKNIPIDFYLTNPHQEKDLLDNQSLIQHPFYIKKLKLSANLFSVLITNETVLIIYGDTFFNENVLKDVIEAYDSNKLSTVTLLKTDNGIDNVDFLIKDNKIIKVISCEKQILEPTQVFLFNSKTTKKIKNLVDKKINRFDILYKHLLLQQQFNVVKCFDDECININEENDLIKIRIK